MGNKRSKYYLLYRVGFFPRSLKINTHTFLLLNIILTIVRSCLLAFVGKKNIGFQLGV